MIIYGWGYFNRRNYSTIRTQCEACGSYGYKQSYESTRFATLYFIPIFPIGSQKITLDCPHCKNKQGLGKGKWKRLTKGELKKAIAAYDASATEESATALVQASVACHSRATLREYGSKIQAQFAHDSELLGLLAQAYSYLCMDAEADETFLSALEKDSGQELTDQSDLHMQAKELPKPKPANRLLQSIPVMIVPVALLFFFSNMIGSGLSKAVDDAYLVNGLDTGYEVLINGEPYKLRPNQERPIDGLVYGLNRIEPANPESPVEAVEFTINGSWSDRMLDSTAVVINPDQAALVLWENSEYTTGNNPDYDYRFYTGKVSYTFEGIDYFFRAFPDEVQVSSATNSTYKKRISTLSDYSSSERVLALFNNGLFEQAQTYLTHKVRAEADASELLNYASGLLDSETLLELIQPKLQSEPVKIEYHRTYQSLQESLHPEHDLLQEYRDKLTAAPNDAALIYLLGRIEPDPQQALTLFKKAYESGQAQGYGANALAFHCLASGQPDKAKDFNDAARERAPDNESFEAYLEEILIANKASTELEAMAEGYLNDDPTDLYAYRIHLTARCLKDPKAQTDKEIINFVNRMVSQNLFTKQESFDVIAGLQAHVALLQGNRKFYRQQIGRFEDPTSRFNAALLDQDLATAQSVLEAEGGSADASEHLLIYTLASKAGKAQAAQAALNSAVETFQQGSTDQRKLATWLSGSEAPSLSELSYTYTNPFTHKVVLAAFAQRFPANSSAYLAHAKKINYQNDFYSMALGL